MKKTDTTITAKRPRIGSDRDAYHAYCHRKDVLAIRAGYDHAGMPAWDDLADCEQDVWYEVACAVLAAQR